MQKIGGRLKDEVLARMEAADDGFRPIRELPANPVQYAVDHAQPGDFSQITKERLAEWSAAGVPGRFWRALEAREKLYRSSFPELAYTGDNMVLWYALNDICRDAGDVGLFARRYRMVRVKEIFRAEREDRAA